VGHLAAAFCKSPPVFCGRRGILAAGFGLGIFVTHECAIPKLLFWRADEKEEAQKDHEQAARKAAREHAAEETGM